MFRIVDGIVFEGKPSPDKRVVTLHDLGNGHREVTVRPVIEWREDGPLHPDSINAQVLRGEREDPNAAEKARLARLRSARRSKTRARRVCKVLGLDTLLTLTYRALVDDLGSCKRHFELFRKRMNKALPGGFRFVAAFERQKRGAWHVHIATRRIPAEMRRGFVYVKSFNVIRAIWRSVVGELGGNVDVSRRKGGKRGAKVTAQSPARVAAYLSKYLTKDWEDWPDGVRRLQTSPCELPEPTRVEVVAANMADVVELCYAFAADGQCVVVTSHLGRFGDTFYLASEPVPRGFRPSLPRRLAAPGFP